MTSLNPKERLESAHLSDETESLGWFSGWGGELDTSELYHRPHLPVPAGKNLSIPVGSPEKPIRGLREGGGPGARGWGKAVVQDMGAESRRGKRGPLPKEHLASGEGPSGLLCLQAHPCHQSYYSICMDGWALSGSTTCPGTLWP